METTRLAPSPTGALHLGNARTFLVNWLLARQRGWRIILRIEDLDGPRIKKGADQSVIADLQWLGIDWDEGPVYQSARIMKYGEAIDALLHKKVSYPCICSRKEVETAGSAPHADERQVTYPGTCRGRYITTEDARRQSGKTAAIRFAVPDEQVIIEDGFAPRRRYDMARELGDFVIAKADGTSAYQLAVVVDDGEMGVTQVVRGDDLLESTPRQMLLYRALNMNEKIPRYFHLPLVVGTDGRRLAKRHGDTRLSYYRNLGVSAERVLGLLAHWCGCSPDVREITSAELLDSFRLETLSHSTVVFSEADDHRLRGIAN